MVIFSLERYFVPTPIGPSVTFVIDRTGFAPVQRTTFPRSPTMAKTRSTGASTKIEHWYVRKSVRRGSISNTSGNRKAEVPCRTLQHLALRGLQQYAVHCPRHMVGRPYPFPFRRSNCLASFSIGAT